MNIYKQSAFTKIYNPIKIHLSTQPVEAFGDVQKLPFVACGPLHVLLHCH
jgi:hypothetical protein